MGVEWTDITQVVLVGLQLIVLTAAAIFGGAQAINARRLREDQARPFVIMDFEVEENWIYLSISNLGRTLAREVAFEISPPFKTGRGRTFENLKMLQEGIATLPPGKTIRTFFDSSIERKNQGLPDVYAVTVRYTDGHPKPRRRRRYEDHFDLDLEIYRNVSWIKRHGIHDMHKTLGEIRDEMRKWTAGTSGLLQMSPNENREEQERRTREIDAMVARQRREEESSDDQGPAT